MATKFISDLGPKSALIAPRPLASLLIDVILPIFCFNLFQFVLGWSGGAMVLGKLPVPGRPTIWVKVGQGPTTLAVGAVGGCLDIFTFVYPFSSLSLSLGDGPI